MRTEPRVHHSSQTYPGSIRLSVCARQAPVSREERSLVRSLPRTAYNIIVLTCFVGSAQRNGYPTYALLVRVYAVLSLAFGIFASAARSKRTASGSEQMLQHDF